MTVTLGGTAQLVAAHCPNERTLALQAETITDPPTCTPQPASPRNVLRQRFTV